ncbi:hypothetical protein HY496_02835 [Candidatus Woesearchaeota archaeon]|nr:hypothetical protein [Candidatus Woesearchaeota archaeon]
MVESLADFAGMVDVIETYAHLIFVALAIYYGWLIFKGGTEGKTAAKAWGVGAAGGKKFWKFGKKVNRKIWSEEKLMLAEYVDLEKLKKAVNNSKVTTDAELKKAVGSKERRAKRHESKAYNRFNQLKKAIEDMSLDASVKKNVNKILNEMEVFTKTIVDAIREFDGILDRAGVVATKKTQMTAAIDKAITADRSFVAKLEDLKKALAT